MSELALAAFASETGAHLIRPPGGRQWLAYVRGFDAQAYEARLAAGGLRFVPRSAAAFPPPLRAIHDPPAGLFLRGGAGAELLARPAVAIVGARACSGYGASVARMLGRELAARGASRRVGSRAGRRRRGAPRRARSRRPTVAVLGCGIDRDYPAAHAQLARQVAATGLLVSEYAPGVEPAPWRFPARNRIVAGLCAATVVVEARERSGALITADLALEEGREVFAVPGEIRSALSAGTNGLLKLGAAPLTCGGRRARVFGLEPAGRRRRPTDAARCSTSCRPRRDELVRANRASRRGGRTGARRARARRRASGRRRRVSRSSDRLSGSRGRESLLARGRGAAAPAAAHDGRVDVAIVGAGITGCSAALAARGGRPPRPGARRARRRRGRERPERRLRAARRRDPLRRRARDVRRRAGARALAVDGARTRAAWRRSQATRSGGPAASGSPSTRRSASRSAREFEAMREDGIEAEWVDDLPGRARGPLSGRHPARGRRRPAAGPLRPPARGARGGGRRGVPRARPGRRRRRARRRAGDRRDRRLRARARARARATRSGRRAGR